MGGGNALWRRLQCRRGLLRIGEETGGMLPMKIDVFSCIVEMLCAMLCAQALLGSSSSGSSSLQQEQSQEKCKIVFQ